MARASAICCSDGREGVRESAFCVMTMVMLKGSQTGGSDLLQESRRKNLYTVVAMT